MSAEETTRPSQRRITEMLAQVESRQRRATRSWLLVLLLPLALGAGLLVFTSYAVSKRLRQIGELDARIAEKQRLVAERDREIADKDRVIQAKTVVIDQAIERITDPGAKAQVLESIASNPAVAATTQRVFIHYPSAAQKGQAEQLRGKVRQLGYVVPATEQLASAPEVRYFFPDDREAAEKVGAAADAQGEALRVVQRSAPKARPGLIEVYLRPAPPAPPAPAGRDEQRTAPDARQAQAAPDADAGRRRQTAPTPARPPR